MGAEAGLTLENVIGVGAGRFRNISAAAGVGYTGHSSGAVFFDYDADGRLDLLVTNVGAYTTDSTGTGGYYVGMEGAFFAHALPERAEPRAGGRTDQVWFALACGEGGADAGSKPCEVCARPDAETNGCRADADGRLTMRGALGSRSSDLSAHGPVGALSVRLRGSRSNRQGLGAQVTLVLPDGRRVLKVADGRSGYLSQSDLPLYFGLGAATEAASIEVRWPSGRQQTVAGPLRPGQIDEPAQRLING